MVLVNLKERSAVGTNTVIKEGKISREHRQEHSKEKEKTNGLNCIMFQCKRLMDKMGNITSRVGSGYWNTLAKTETWIRVGLDWKLSVPGYRCDRDENKREGCFFDGVDIITVL